MRRAREKSDPGWTEDGDGQRGVGEAKGGGGVGGMRSDHEIVGTIERPCAVKRDASMCNLVKMIK